MVVAATVRGKRPKVYCMSYSLNSSKVGYIEDYVGKTSRAD